jgi:hypothetical protein
MDMDCKAFLTQQGLRLDDAVSCATDLANDHFLSLAHLLMWHETMAKEFAHYIPLKSNDASLKPWTDKFRNEIDAFISRLYKAWENAVTPHERLAIIELKRSVDAWAKHVNAQSLSDNTGTL